ncbi:MAG: hypothetical protein JXA93_15840, partial [Anaerolineae bacterium]|nr:hypothetical protein [Anaerolineae bacterium]
MPSTKMEWQGPLGLPSDADETIRRLLSANTAHEVLAAVVDMVADSADFGLVLQLGRVPGADLEVTAEWGVETGMVTAPERRIPYRMLAPFLDPGLPGDGTPEAMEHRASPDGDRTGDAVQGTRNRAWEPDGARMLLWETTVVTDTGDDERVDPAFRQLLEQMHVGSFVAVPMNFQGQTRTVLVFGRRQPGEYGSQLVRRYERIATQVESALRNLVLLQQSQTRAAQLEVVA